MPTVIRVLGKPVIERDGVIGPAPRGHKTWVLLAALILAHRAVSRAWAAEVLFANADDPRAALRWSIAELRRKLGDAATLQGDPLTVRFAAGTTVDLLDEAPQEALRLVVGHRIARLLEGVELPDLPDGEQWLARSRETCRRRVVTRLIAAAETSLAQGASSEAVMAADALVADDPLDEARHLLLVRALAATGDRAAAVAAVQRCQAVLMRELGVAASPVLLAAACVPARAPVELVDRDRILSRTLLEAARSALASGAVQVGLAHLADAEAAAHRSSDELLLSEVLFARGSAVVHAVASSDSQAREDLRRSAALAIAGGRPTAAASALRELAFARASARHPLDGLLARAEALSDDDPAEHAAVLGIRAFARLDDGRYTLALADFTASMRSAEAAGAGRQLAWAWTLRARAHLQRGDLAAAGDDLSGAAHLVQELRWTAFVPFVRAQQGMLAVRENRLGDAADLIASGWTTATLTGDRCWLSLLAQVAGLVAAGQGRPQEALTVLADAYAAQDRTLDRCRWIDASLLDSLVAVAAAVDPARAMRAAVRLGEVAERDRMPEYAFRSAAWRLQLGDTQARAKALATLEDVDNPALAELI